MKRRMIWRALFAAPLLLALPAAGQTRVDRAEAASDQDAVPPAQPLRTVESGRVATSVVGRVGERQAQEGIVGIAQPLGRINSRINSRLALRNRNRIDRNYDPAASATSSFAKAQEELESTSRGLTR